MSLQNISLNTVINNFDYYNKLYRRSKDEKVLRLFEFLQRKFSFEVVSRLHAKKVLREDYIDLTVNKHLKVLSTEWLSDCSWVTIETKFEEIGDTLLKVHFYHLPDLEMNECIDGIPWEDVICHLPNLKELYLKSDCQGKILENIAKYCENIEEIEIGGHIQKDSIKALCFKEDGKVPCSKLKRFFVSSFSLDRNKVSEDDMEYLLKNLPSLERTNCYDLHKLLYKLHKDDLSALDKVKPYKLVCLDLLRSNFPLLYVEKDKLPYYIDLLKICLSVCPNLKALKSYLINEETLELISKLDQLEKLHLSSVDYEIDVNNLLISSGGQLTSLTLYNCTVSVSSLAKNCTHLKQLNFYAVHFIVDDSDSKLYFPCLQSCTFIRVTDTTDKAMKLVLSSAPKLKSIAFKMLPLKSPAYKRAVLNCCENCPIKFINIRGSVVEISFLRDIIVNCHSLKRLNVGGCRLPHVNEEELRLLAKERPNNPNIYFHVELRSDWKTFEEESDDGSVDESDDDFISESEDDDLAPESDDNRMSESEDGSASDDYVWEMESDDDDDDWLTDSAEEISMTDSDDDFMELLLSDMH